MKTTFLEAKLTVQCVTLKSVKKTHMKAMESCFRSFSKFFMFANDCAQKMMAIHEHTLYCIQKPVRFHMS